MTVLADKPTIIPDLPAADYHAIRAVSASFLKSFINESPAHAKAMLDSMGEAKDDDTESDALLIGTAVHAAVLEPEKYDKQYIVGPDAARNTKAWKEFEAEQRPGTIILKPAQRDLVEGMARAVSNHRRAAKLLAACDRRELSIFWTIGGIPCKARIDLYSTVAGCLVDLKTTINASPREFGASAVKWGYPISLPWYSRALQVAGLPCSSVGIIAVEKTAPFPVVVYEPDPYWFSFGEDAIEQAIGKLKTMWDQDQWPGYAEDDEIVTLTLPRWAFNGR